MGKDEVSTDVALEEAGELAVRPRCLILSFLSGALSGHTFEYAGPRRLVLGRSKDCDIEVFDSRVSRRHCSLDFDGETLLVKDLGSANGTLLNGCPVGLLVARTGDILRIADTQIRIELADNERTVCLKRVAFAPQAETGEVLRDPSLRIELPGYQLAGVLGEGATSAVFKARRRDDGEVVAIKVLRVGHMLDPEERERFVREAATASALVHPNVVRVFGHGATDEHLYTVMEFVPGETVRERIRRLGPLPVPVALHVARQVAAALEHAREKRIVHRDVKPENILIREDGVAKLLDFGLAKSVDAAAAAGLTRVGDVLGTLAYMSPEQLESSVSADHRSDIYSLGATLYHMLSGVTPFAATTNAEYFAKILHEEPPVLALSRPGVPPIVSAMVARSMRKKASARYQRAEEIVHLATQLLAADEQRTTLW